MSEPQRIRLSRAKGWRLPEGVVKVDRSTRYGNPFRPGAKIICPGRWNSAGSPYDGSLNVGSYANAARGPDYEIRLVRDRADAVALFASWVRRVPAWQPMLRDLAGKSLACWCPLPGPGEPDICHAAILLKISNEEAADA